MDIGEEEPHVRLGETELGVQVKVCREMADKVELRQRRVEDEDVEVPPTKVALPPRVDDIRRENGSIDDVVVVRSDGGGGMFMAQPTQRSRHVRKWKVELVQQRETGPLTVTKCKDTQPHDHYCRSRTSKRKERTESSDEPEMA